MVKFKKLPTKDELIIFYYNRYVVGNKKDTLPFLVEIWAQEFVEEYTAAFQEFNLTIDAALEILEKSRPRELRA